MSDETKSDRLTLRLAARDLDGLRELATQRKTDVATLGREAIRAYLDALDPELAKVQLGQELRTVVRQEVDRAIRRTDEQAGYVVRDTKKIIDALIAAMNRHWADV